ncbi:unnamed protein product [Malus baccata var. baccata]
MYHSKDAVLEGGILFNKAYGMTAFEYHVAPDSSLAIKGVVHIDVILLAHNPGGKERAEKEFEALTKGSGYQGFRVIRSAFNTYVIEFLKKN